MPELRKRKTAETVAPLLGKKPNLVNSTSADTSAANGVSLAKTIDVGDSISLDGFGGEVETNDGDSVTLKALVDTSENGVVLFTYPKASTPGCTTQACLFRDDFMRLTATGFSIYGLSTDSPKSNTTFKLKQKLPYTLLCDPKAVLISPIGMKKSPSGTIRGVFVVDKVGKVQAAASGGPAATIEMVRQLMGADQSRPVALQEAPSSIEGEKERGPNEHLVRAANHDTASNTSDIDQAKAEIAAEVAKKLD
ncbi:MAG: hypothetical protein Q9164_006494, partial [Protoblastenia rupestris]